MITRIEANRYRCFENIGIDIPRYAVLVGSNGAGKTTLLDIPNLLRDCLAQRDITQAFTQTQQGKGVRCTALRELVHRNLGNEFFFALEAALPSETTGDLVKGLPASQRKNESYWPKIIRYEVRLEIFNEKQLQVKNEYLFFLSSKNTPARTNSQLHGETPGGLRFIIKREYGHDAQFRLETQQTAKLRPIKVDASMLSLPRVQFESKEDYPAASWFYDLFSQDYLFYQPDVKALQTASPPGLADTLLPDASNLPHLALALQKQDVSRFNLWQEHVKTALPGIEHIEAREREEDHHVYFRIVYQGGHMVTSSGLSEGTVLILALTILPYLKKLPAIVFIEEPENGVYPQAIETILQSLSSAYYSQVLTSTHSPIVLANSSLDQILCARIDANGAAAIVAGRDHPQLKDWKGGIDLGALFASGVFE